MTSTSSPSITSMITEGLFVPPSMPYALLLQYYIFFSDGNNFAFMIKSCTDDFPAEIICLGLPDNLLVTNVDAKHVLYGIVPQLVKDNELAILPAMYLS